MAGICFSPYHNSFSNSKATMVQKTCIADIHFNTTLNTVDPDPDGPYKGNMLSKAPIWVPSDKRIEDVDTSKQLRMNIRSYGQPLTAGAFVVCHGRFWCTKEGGDVIVHVRAFDNYPSVRISFDIEMVANN